MPRKIKFGDMFYADEPRWCWVYCAHEMTCQHCAPVAIMPLVIRWGEFATFDKLRRSARCTKCGRKGATLKRVSWGDMQVGWAPFPEREQETDPETWHMCGRYTRNYTWEQIHALYSLTLAPSNFQPRFNICPTTTVDTVVGAEPPRTLVPMRWGLVPAWWNKPLKEMKLATFNARAETVAQKPMFRSVFKRNRCIIPASGYYEWQDTKEGKQPYYFTPREGDVLSIAGIWDEWKNPETNETIRSCAMIITEPNDFVRKMHDRMPVLLKPNQLEWWLSGKAGIEYLMPADDDILNAWPVSRRINSSGAPDEDASLIVSIE